MWFLCLALLCLISAFSGQLVAEDRVLAAYDPLAKLHAEKVVPQDLTVYDQARNRDIPIRVYRCGEIKSAPVLLFSHGLGG